MNAAVRNNAAQRGAVLIMVLWTTVVLTVLVTVLASNVRLSANTAVYHRQGAQDFASVMSAMYKAEMELMMERMPVPAGVIASSQALTEYREPLNRFNGQPLSLNYPADENIVVRIYDHAGKININRIQRQRLQRLIETRLGENFDPVQVQELLAAWSDWTDLNDLPNPGGAENEYYLSLDPPYTARNSPEFDTVEEIRLIRGFDELFKDVNLDAAFTVYGNGSAVNPNLATREALLLLPGLDAELVEQIIALREQQDITSPREIGDIVPLEKMVELSPWLGFNTSSVYSVYAYPRQESDDSTAPDRVTQAYMQIMEVRGFETRARIYRVHPYAQLPK
ncbi:MAG: type II secretion system protein GspK [Pseudohongiella sp.]|nr:type II secretion system protein GspK [Pseudohongiella sp.]